MKLWVGCLFMELTNLQQRKYKAPSVYYIKIKFKKYYHQRVASISNRLGQRNGSSVEGR